MKKITVMLLAFMMLLLTGCGKITATEEAIAAIGNVNMESLQSIEAAEEQLSELPEGKWAKVENIDVLMDARKEYDRLAGAVEAAEKAIAAIGKVTYSSGDAIEAAQEAYNALRADGLTDYVQSSYLVLTSAQKQYDNMVKEVERVKNAIAEIGEVTLESESAIKKARKAYNSLTHNNLTSYVEDSYAVLKAAEEKYLQLVAEDMYQSAMQLFEAKKYEDAEKQFADLQKKYPQSGCASSALQKAIACKVAVANQYRKASDLENAWYTLEACVKSYPSSKADEAYRTAMSQLEADLEAARPKNGKVLKNKSITGGYSEFVVEAGSTDALVKLESVDNPEKYVLFYVRAGESAKVNVKEGRYIAKYVVGSIWFNKTDMFGRDSQFVKADSIIDFEVEYKGGYVYYSTTTMTLYSVQGGNLSTTDIPASSF